MFHESVLCLNIDRISGNFRPVKVLSYPFGRGPINCFILERLYHTRICMHDVFILPIRRDRLCQEFKTIYIEERREIIETHNNHPRQ